MPFVTASGTLGSTSFSNKAVTISGLGDTSTRISPRANVYSIALIGQVAIAGVGSATITDSFLVFISQSGPQAGFADATTQQDTLDFTNSSLGSYDLTTAVGPVSGPVAYLGTVLIGTTAGSFRLTSTTSSVSFTASPAAVAVPEPSSLVLCGIAGVAGLGVSRARRRVAG